MHVPGGGFFSRLLIAAQARMEYVFVYLPEMNSSL